MANYLEQLVAEWYEYQGYFVRRNVSVGKRPRGGYECELDVVAFHPSDGHLVHIEPSMDTDSWETRERRYRKKFRAGRKHIRKLFDGFEVPEEIDQIALFVYASKKNRTQLGGGELRLMSEMMAEIMHVLRQKPLDTEAIPENFPILRSFQFVAYYRKAIAASLL